jgi:hypothetical protein
VPADLEKLAYDSALRALDKQERLVEELRARAGVVLAASSLAVSFLAGRGFGGPGAAVLGALALLSFVVSVGATVIILLPSRDFRFSPSASDLIVNLSEFREDPSELFRRAADVLDRLWERNDAAVYRRARSLSIAATAPAIEVLALAALLGGSII